MWESTPHTHRLFLPPLQARPPLSDFPTPPHSCKHPIPSYGLPPEGGCRTTSDGARRPKNRSSVEVTAKRKHSPNPLPAIAEVEPRQSRQPSLTVGLLRFIPLQASRCMPHSDMPKRIRDDALRCVGVGVSLSPADLEYLRSFNCPISDAVRRVIILARQQQAHLQALKESDAG